MMEGLKEALQYIAGLKAESMEPAGRHTAIRT